MLRKNTTAVRRLIALCFAVFALGLAGAPGDSHALELNFGVALGQASFDADRFKAGSFTGTEDDTDSAWKLIFGGPMFENFNLELTIVDLGKFSKNSTSGTVISESSKARGLTVEGIGFYPFNDTFSVLGRVGMFRHDFDTTCSVGGTNCSGNTSTADITYGLGARYRLTGTVDLRAEWQRYGGLGDGTTASGDIDLLSISVLYRYK
jgi:OOP family OmpA-OmpF porin